MNIIYPIIGIFTSLLLYVSPFYEVIRFTNKPEVNSEFVIEINKFNPLPIMLALLTTSIWSKYASMIDDLLLLLANIPGLLTSITSIIILLPKINKHKDLKICQIILIGGLLFQVILFTIFDNLDLSLEYINIVFGILSNLFFLSMCVSPLYTFRKVVKEKDSSSLFLPLALTQTSNCTLWIIYGVNQNNFFITIPNSIGLFLGTIQLFLILVFNKRCGSL